MTPGERLDAKVANERLKLAANLLNGLAGGVFLGGIITPLFTSKPIDLWVSGFSIGGAIVLHLVAQLVLFDLKPED